MLSLRLIGALCLSIALLASNAFAAVDWSTITTAQQMTALDPSEFSSLDASGASQIAAEACGGFLPAQVSNVPSEAFAGFSSGCLSFFATSAAPAVTADQLSNLSNSSCIGMRFEWVSALTTEALSGWSASCVAASGDNTDLWRSIDVTLFKRFPASVFSGMTGNIVNATNAALWSSVTEEQLSALAAAAFGGFNQQSASRVPSGLLPVVTATQAQYLSASACSGVNVGLFSVATWANMSDSECTTGADLTQLDAARLAVLSNITCQSIVVHTFNRSAIAAMTPICVANWFDCEEMSPETLPMLGSSQVSAINIICAKNIPDSAWKNVTSQTIAALTGPVCYRIRAWDAIPAQAYAGMTAHCLAGLDSGFDPVCATFPTLAAQFIPGAVFRNVSGRCFAAFSPAFISMLPITSTGNLTAEVVSDTRFFPAVKYMSPAQIQSVPVDVFYDLDASRMYPGMNQAQVLAIFNKPDGYKLLEYWSWPMMPTNLSLSVQCWNNWQKVELIGKAPSMPKTSKEVVGTTWMRLYFVPPVYGMWTSDTLNYLTEEESIFFPLSHVSTLTPSVLSNLSGRFCVHMSQPVFRALTTSQFAALDPFCLSNLDLAYWKFVTIYQIKALSSKQVGSFPDNCVENPFSVMSCSQLEAFSWSMQLDSFWVHQANRNCYLKNLRVCDPKSPLFAPTAAPRVAAPRVYAPSSSPYPATGASGLVGIIAGAVGGGIAFIVAVVVIVYCCCCKKNMGPGYELVSTEVYPQPTYAYPQQYPPMTQTQQGYATQTQQRGYGYSMQTQAGQGYMSSTIQSQPQAAQGFSSPNVVQTQPQGAAQGYVSSQYVNAWDQHK